MSDQPVASRSSLYFERYAQAERYAAAMGTAFYVMCVVCVFLAAGVVMMALRPRPIHYVAQSPTGGLSYPGRVPVVSVASFASFWILNWANYGPETARSVYERSMLLMAPAFSAKVRSHFDEELGKIGRERISSVFSLGQEPHVEENRRGFTVVLVGESALYIGKEEMLREPVRFTAEIRMCPINKDNPYGLVIWDLKKERAGV